MLANIDPQILLLNRVAGEWWCHAIGEGADGKTAKDNVDELQAYISQNQLVERCVGALVNISICAASAVVIMHLNVDYVSLLLLPGKWLNKPSVRFSWLLWARVLYCFGTYSLLILFAGWLQWSARYKHCSR